MNVNNVIISGNLTRDPELKYTPSGKAVVQFTVANNNKYTRDGQAVEEVSFIKVTAWDKTAEHVAQYLAKGSGVLIEGRLKQETWEKDGEKKEKTGVIASRVHFTSKPKERSSDSGSANQVSLDMSGSEQAPF